MRAPAGRSRWSNPPAIGRPGPSARVRNCGDRATEVIENSCEKIRGCSYSDAVSSLGGMERWATQEHMPLQKTIGQAKAEIVPSLIVMNARGSSRRAAR